jgi:small subunit ribosomal protein S2
MAKTKDIDISLEELLEAGAHFGHQYRRWNPKMKPYMFDVREKIFVFDLLKTQGGIAEALKVLTKAASEGKVILFVGTKKQAKAKVKEVAQACECPYVSERWLGGTLTNFEQVRRSVDSMAALEEKLKTAKQEGYTKKERLLLERKIEKLKKSFGGIISLKDKPDLMVIIDTHKERGAVLEAKKLKIETIGIVDSNADPTSVDFVVPMNDDASKAIDYVLDLFKEAILRGKKEVTKKKKK